LTLLLLLNRATFSADRFAAFIWRRYFFPTCVLPCQRIALSARAHIVLWGNFPQRPDPSPGERQPVGRSGAQNLNKVLFRGCYSYLLGYFSGAVAPLSLLYRLTFPSLTFCSARFTNPARFCSPRSRPWHRKKDPATAPTIKLLSLPCDFVQTLRLPRKKIARRGSASAAACSFSPPRTLSPSLARANRRRWSQPG
jgi:hypothetical protein